MLYDYQFLYYQQSKDRSCDLRLVEDNLLQSGIGFGMRKGFSTKSIIDDVVLKYREHEIITSLRKKWFSNICQRTFLAATQKRLTINRFGGIIFVLALTAILSFPLLIPEHLYTKYMKNIVLDKIRKIFHTETKRDTACASESDQRSHYLMPSQYTPIEISTKF